MSIRSDNGSEFVCEALASWLPGKGTEPIQVAPGSPWENGVGESFNSRFRDEFLEREEFEDDRDAREKGRWFKREYNTDARTVRWTTRRPGSSATSATPGCTASHLRATARPRPAVAGSPAMHNDLSRSSIGGLDPGGSN